MRKRHAVVLLAMLVASCAGPPTVQPDAQPATAPDKPPQVLRVAPPDGATTARVEAVEAELDLTRGEPGDAASLQLFLDGVDVTPQATVGGTRDVPPSRISIAYSPPRLSPGPHRAEVRFRTAGGRPVSYAWRFTTR